MDLRNYEVRVTKEPCKECGRIFPSNQLWGDGICIDCIGPEEVAALQSSLCFNEKTHKK